VIAFLNYREGGQLFVGIDKNGTIPGIVDPDGDQLKIKDRLKHNISPSCMGLFDVVAEQKEGKNIIRIIVASGSEKPYFLRKFGMTEKGCFIHIGSASEPMQQKMIDDLFSKRTRNSISKIKSNRQDLSFEQLKIYYEAKGSKLNTKFAQNLELLNEDEFFNYAAYLLADNNGTSIKVAKYKGRDRVNLIENNEYGYCSLIKATKQVLDKLELENKTLSKITPKERENQRLWNPIALREAVINAIIHNDYTNEAPPKFEIFDDRIEITSSGGLPEALSQEEFFEGVSIPRNKELMRIFRDLDMVEQLGSGIPRILEHYGKECFKFMQNFLRMTLINQIKDETVGQIGDQEGLVEGLLEGLVESQKYMVQLIVQNSKISKRELAEHIGISTTAIDKNLATLKAKNIIRRVGSDKSRHWEIITN
jgi:ATP-dependent DNA helicase RecG